MKASDSIIHKDYAKQIKIKGPRKTAGAANQKPLTIKPYPMKIRNEYNSKQRSRALF